MKVIERLSNDVNFLYKYIEDPEVYFTLDEISKINELSRVLGQYAQALEDEYNDKY